MYQRSITELFWVFTYWKKIQGKQGGIAIFSFCEIYDTLYTASYG